MSIRFISTDKVLNIAHRGARAFAPENTLAAFAKAKALGADMFETDIRLTKDNIIVIHHDENLKRCTNAEIEYPHSESFEVADFTYDQLTSLDAGGWFNTQLNLPKHDRQPYLQDLSDNEISDLISDQDRRLYASGTVKIPTLADTLKLAYELDILVNIELKSPTHNLPALIDCTLEQIIGLRLSEKVIISSFDHGMLSEIRKRNKTIALAALTEHPLKAPVSYLKKLKADACNLGCFHGYRNVGFKSSHGRRYLDHIAKLRKHYFDVNIWTCNNVDEMTDLVRHGVDGLISDFPNRVQQILNDKSILRA